MTALLRGPEIHIGGTAHQRQADHHAFAPGDALVNLLQQGLVRDLVVFQEEREVAVAALGPRQVVGVDHKAARVRVHQIDNPVVGVKVLRDHAAEVVVDKLTVQRAQVAPGPVDLRFEAVAPRAHAAHIGLGHVRAADIPAVGELELGRVKGFSLIRDALGLPVGDKGQGGKLIVLFNEPQGSADLLLVHLREDVGPSGQGLVIPQEHLICVLGDDKEHLPQGVL